MSAATEAYLWCLYSRCTTDDGIIVLADQSKRRPIGHYRVDEVDRLANDIRRNPGCFLKVNVFDGGKMAERLREKVKQHGCGYVVGNTDEVKTIIGIGLDVDAGKSEKYLSRAEALQALEAMPKPPTLIVNSDGDWLGFHSYWLLRQPVRIESEEQRKLWEAKATRWQKRLQALAKQIGGKSIDSTADIARFLRPVGSLRSSGNRVLTYCYTPGRFYAHDDLYIPPDDDEIQADAKARVQALFNDKLGPVSDSDKPIQAYVDAARITPEQLLSEAGYTDLGNGQWRRPDASSAGRSLLIATGLDRPGINSFSGADPLFACLKRDGGVGAFHSVDSMFVRVRFGGDWKAASAWSRSKIDEQRFAGVSIGHIVNRFAGAGLEVAANG